MAKQYKEMGFLFQIYFNKFVLNILGENQTL